jgi:DNA polymerase III alpha subunit (gram-positive type)
MLVVVFDVETTGLIENPAKRLALQPEIISFASVSATLAEGEIFNDYYKIIKPKNNINQIITNITGLTNSTLKQFGVPIEDCLDKIIEILEDGPIVLGQNVQFDVTMIELECARYGKTIKWPPKIDLVQNAIHLRGYRLTLTELHKELFGEAFEGAHEANVDVRITAKCAIAMYQKGLL